MKKNKLYKHLKKTVSDKKTSQVLNCIRYEKDGSLIASDSYRVLKIDGYHSLNNPINLDIFTFKANQLRYPVITNHSKHKLIVKCSLEGLARKLKELKLTNKKIKLVTSEEGSSHLLNEQGEEIYQLEIIEHQDNFNLTLDINFMLDGLSFMQDTEVGDDELFIHCISNVRAITLKVTDPQYSYMIMPIKVHSNE